MWNFLGTLLNLIPWSKVYEKCKPMFNIPAFLLYALIGAILCGLVYVCYQRYYDTNQQQIQELQQIVTTLNDKVVQNVDNEDYNSDYGRVIDCLALSSKMQQFQYEEMQIQMDVIYKHLQKVDKNDPYLRNIEVSMERNRTEYNLLNQHMQEFLENMKKTYREKGVK